MPLVRNEMKKLIEALTKISQIPETGAPNGCLRLSRRLNS
jgi:hypothetical protein